MTYDRELLTDFEEEQQGVTLADGNVLKVKGRGTAYLDLYEGGIKLTDVLYVPKIDYNLVSVLQLTDKHAEVRMNRNEADIYRNGTIVAKAKRKNNSYVFRLNEKVRFVTDNKQTILWHERLAHPSNEKQRLISTSLLGIPKHASLSGKCNTCSITKAVRQQNKGPIPKATRKLERIYIDF